MNCAFLYMAPQNEFPCSPVQKKSKTCHYRWGLSSPHSSIANVSIQMLGTLFSLRWVVTNNGWRFFDNRYRLVIRIIALHAAFTTHTSFGRMSTLIGEYCTHVINGRHLTWWIKSSHFWSGSYCWVWKGQFMILNVQYLVWARIIDRRFKKKIGRHDFFWSIDFSLI